MSFKDIFKKSVIPLFETDFSASSTILCLFITLLLGIFIFAIYRISSKKTFYSVGFAKSLVGLPVITAGIVLAMQASLVVSLGMVGALSIVRFRNAVKETMDLMFLFWAISVGIICGTGLFSIAVILSVVMCIIVLGMDYIPAGKSPYILIISATENIEDSITFVLKSYSKYYKIKTRSLSCDRAEYILEINVKKEQELINAISCLKGVTDCSLIAHDGEIRFK